MLLPTLWNLNITTTAAYFSHTFHVWNLRDYLASFVATKYDMNPYEVMTTRSG